MEYRGNVVPTVFRRNFLPCARDSVLTWYSAKQISIVGGYWVARNAGKDDVVILARGAVPDSHLARGSTRWSLTSCRDHHDASGEAKQPLDWQEVQSISPSSPSLPALWPWHASSQGPDGLLTRR